MNNITVTQFTFKQNAIAWGQMCSCTYTTEMFSLIEFKDVLKPLFVNIMKACAWTCPASFRVLLSWIKERIHVELKDFFFCYRCFQILLRIKKKCSCKCSFTVTINVNLFTCANPVKILCKQADSLIWLSTIGMILQNFGRFQSNAGSVILNFCQNT